jgi:hypothetical protein
VLQGIYIVTIRAQTLNGAGTGRMLTKATLVVKYGNLGTGVLLGVTAASQPDSQLLSAVSFNFLQPPISSAIAVDMPSVAIEELVFRPEVSISSSIK